MKDPSTPMTMMDVAEEAGVSIATVSRVLNNRADVADETRQRVKAAIERLGYNGQAAGRQKARQALTYIPLIIHAADNEYNGEIIRGVTDQLDSRLHQVTIHLTKADAEIEARHIQVARQVGSEGLLIVNSQIPESDLVDLIGEAVPYVMIDSYADLPTTPAVRATNWQSARQATEHLIELGHRRIGVITGRENDKIIQARKHGYHSSLLEAELPFEPDLIVPGDYTWGSGFQAATALLTRPNPPTALLIFSDQMAMGAVEAIRVAGLQIPQDISVIAFDDLPTLRQLHPPLTTIRQPFYEMARMAARMLLDLIAGQALVSPQIVLPSQLVERQSCGPVPVRPDQQQNEIVDSQKGEGV